VRVTELGAGVEPLAFRLLCLTARYRAKLSVSEDSLRAAQAGLASLRALARTIGRATAGAIGPGGLVAPGPVGPDGVVPPGTGAAQPSELGDAARAAFERWTAAIDDDLDLPRAVALLRLSARDTSIPPPERRWLVLEADRVLGLDLAEAIEAGAVEAAAGGGRSATDPAALTAAAAELLRERADARSARDWARSDRLRAALAEQGVEVIDGPGGEQQVRLRDR
jgi:cysteinyl-tRNA synthetase